MSGENVEDEDEENPEENEEMRFSLITGKISKNPKTNATSKVEGLNRLPMILRPTRRT